MHLSWLIRIRSIWYALVLHIIAAALLVFSFDFTTPIKPQALNVNIVNAVAVDKAQVEKELQNLKKEDEKKQQAEKDRLAELEKKAEDLKKQRQEEEKKLLEAKKKKEQEKKLREEEQKKLAELEKEKAQVELDKQLAEEEKQHAAEEQKKKETELKKQEEEHKKAEKEKQDKAAEQALQDQLDKELAAAAAQEQQAADQKLAVSLGNDIHNKIARNFNLTGLPEGLSCKLRVNLLPTGEVLNAAIIQTSGNEIFDRRALTAVQKASPLPVPQDGDTFERLNMRETTISFEP